MPENEKKPIGMDAENEKLWEDYQEYLKNNHIDPMEGMEVGEGFDYYVSYRKAREEEGLKTTPDE